VETLALLDLASNTELHLDRLVNDETEFGAGLCSVYEAGLVMAQIATGKDLGRLLLAQVGHFKYPSQTAEMESYQRLENAAISQLRFFEVMETSAGGKFYMKVLDRRNSDVYSQTTSTGCRRGSNISIKTPDYPISLARVLSFLSYLMGLSSCRSCTPVSTSIWGGVLMFTSVTTAMPLRMWWLAWVRVLLLSKSRFNFFQQLAKSLPV